MDVKAICHSPLNHDVVNSHVIKYFSLLDNANTSERGFLNY